MELSGPVSGHFFAGNDHVWEFTVTEDDVAVDITGMTFRFVMARSASVTAVLSTEDATAVAAESTPAAGKFTITVTDVNTEGLSGTYLFQAQVEDLSGDRSNVLHGYYTFKENMIPADTTA